MKTLLLVLLVLWMSPIALAQDYAREKRWADEIVPTLVVGDAVMIRAASGHEFLALYAPAKGAKSAIVLVHAIHGNHVVVPHARNGPGLAQ